MKRASIGIFFVFLITVMIGYVVQTTEEFVSQAPSEVMIDQHYLVKEKVYGA